MTPAIHRRPASLLAMMLLAAGCVAEPGIELPPLLEQSDHLVLRGYEDVCADTFVEMEARVVAIQEFFHAPASRVSYNWMQDEFPSAGCVEGALACARGSEVFAKEIAVEHELIHAARASNLPVVLEEGLATFLGGNQMAESTREELGMAIETGGPFSYTTASEFVQFLIQIGGFEKLRELDDRSDYEQEFSTWRPQFEAVYGQTWEEVWTAYLESPWCSPESMSDDVWLCYGADAPVIEMPSDGSDLEYLHDMDCSGPGVVGPFSSGRLRHEIAVEFDPDTPTTVFVGVEGNLVPGSRMKLTRCGPCNPALFGMGEGTVLDDTHYWTIVDVQGRYVLELLQPADAGGQLGVSFTLE